MKLLSLSNPKTRKGESEGWLTAILHLAPSTSSGFQVCPMASEGCKAACLNYTGRGRMQRVQDARIRKTRLFFENRAAFMESLTADIYALERKAAREGMKPALRLNGTSDIPWERVAPDLFERFSHLQFYDYTKRPLRDVPSNYHLTFSRSESNEADVERELDRGVNVAVVFHELPETWKGRRVVNGDISDLRFLDPVPTVVGLRAKGLARKDLTGFVV